MNFKEILPFLHNYFICPSHKVIIKNKDYGYGLYHDPDDQLLHAAFQVLVDYVEIDCTYAGPDYLNTPLQNLFELLDEIPTLRWLIPHTYRRNALQGLLKLKWEMSLKDEHPSQSESAEAFYKLYKFWKHDRPQRQDPWDFAEDESFERYEPTPHGKSRKFTKIYSQKLKEAGELEDKYHEEDQTMLQLLIKHRRSMWV